MDLAFGCHRVVFEWKVSALNPSGMTQVCMCARARVCKHWPPLLWVWLC